MAKIIFISGGARSGKSRYALEIAGQSRGKKVFMATCEPGDVEMRKRIKLHKDSRPADWQTIEEYLDIDKAAAKIPEGISCVIIDCLTLLVSNLMLAGYNQSEIEKKIIKAMDHLKRRPGQVIIVSNEVGLGIVPNSKLGRDFRDAAGRVNQIAAGKADKVFFMVSGIPLKIK